MTAGELIKAVEEAGGNLEVHGDRLRYCLPGEVAGRLLPELRRHKLEIIAALRRPETGPREFRPGEPVTKAALRETSDPAARAVYELLRDGEYTDERGVIRKVQ